MRLAYYAGASTAAAAACLVKAFHERPNFYSATVYLSQSNACLLILTNLLLVGAVTFMYCLQRLLYGPLRPIEIEQLSEKAWYAVLDTLLAMPSFREDVGAWLLTMFVLLLAGKVWGWIAEGRVDILEQQPPANPRLFHARLASSLLLSVSFDVYMTYYCLETVVADPRPGMMVIFTFEFAILTIFSIFTLLRYLLNVAATEITKQQTLKAIEERKKELQAERAAVQQNQTEDGTSMPGVDEPIVVAEDEVDVPGWEEKRRYLFVLEVLTDFAKLILYVVFFTVSVTFNGLPMHIMRDVYMTFASFSKRLSDYVNYKKATSDMNARYPDATTAEIRDDSCIVCRETMVAWEDGHVGAAPAAEAARPRRDEGLRAKKLPCGHILHLRCLKAWLERQQVCPTCRRPVLTTPVNRQTQVPRVEADPNQAPAQAPAAPPENGRAQPHRPNRARFFNLGPVRIGFLNGPAGQINELVNQLQGVPARQEQNNVPAGPSTQAQPAQSVTVPNGATNIAPANTRMTPADLTRLQTQILQEAERLTTDRAQLHLMSLMANELARLQAVQAQRDLQNTAVAEAMAQSSPASAHNPVQTTLTGHPAQSVTADSTALPAGLTLPPGWTLMPLHAQQVPVHAGLPHIHPLAQALRTAPLAQQAAAQAVTHTDDRAAQNVAEQQPIMHTASEEAGSTSLGPTDPSGSPLFVPTPEVASAPSQHTESTQSLPSSAAHGTTGVSDGPSVPSWSSQSWNFEGSPATTGSTSTAAAEPEREDSTTNHAGASGRNVAVEEVPDSQT